MCVAVPGKIVSIDDFDMGEVDFGGVSREVSLSLIEEPAVGEYVIVHAGFALHKLPTEEALETIEMMRKALDGEPF